MCLSHGCFASLRERRNLKAILDDEGQAIIESKNQTKSSIDNGEGSHHETIIPTMRELATIVHQIRQKVETFNTLQEAQISQQKIEAAARLFDSVKEQYKIQDTKI